MITPVMHQRIDFHMDKVKSPRLKRDLHKDQSLNIAQDKFINVFADTFQLDQYSRDCMRNLVRKDVSCTVAGNIVAYPSDYRQMLGLTLTINGVTKYWTREMLYIEKGPVFENSFLAPDADNPSVIESNAGITVYCGSGTLSAALMDYIIIPTEILYSTTAVTIGPACVTVGLVYYVESGSVVHNSVTYSAGQTFTAVTTALTGTGTVYLIQNSLLGDQCHEEMCKMAAALISGTIEDIERFQIKSLEAKR